MSASINSFMNSISQTIKKNQTMVIVAIVLAVAGTLAYLIAYKKQGFPCFCPQCEQKIIDAANAGDPTAQQMLADAIQPSPPSYLSFLGPFGIIVFMVVLLWIVANVAKQPPQMATNFFDQLRQRVPNVATSPLG